MVLTGLPLSVRRLHDTNKTGFWLLVALVPVGGLVLLVCYLMGGHPGPQPLRVIAGGQSVSAGTAR